MAQPAVNSATLAAQLRHAPAAAADTIAAMRNDAEERIAALEESEGEGSGFYVSPQVTVPALGATDADVFTICHCPVECTFSQALLIFEGSEAVTCNDNNYKTFEIYEYDADGQAVGLWLAQGTTQATGALALDNDEGSLLPHAQYEIPLTGEAITIGAGHTAKVAVYFGGTGVAVPRFTVVLVPSV